MVGIGCCYHRTVRGGQASVSDVGGFYDRLKGAVYGAAIGDALGAAFESLNSARIERELREPVARHYVYALPGSLLYPRNPGIPSDHTAMALALANALLEPTPSQSTVAAQFQRDLEPNGTFGPLFWNGKPSAPCIAMLRGEQVSADARDNTAATRAYPCSVYRDPSRVLQVAGLQASLSHGHASAIASAQVAALLVHDALYTAAMPLIFPQTIGDDRVNAAWVRRHAIARSSTLLPTHLRDVDSYGWETVAGAHAISLLHSNDPETAIGMAAASGNDTSAIASIVGAMVGAVNGFSALPRRWVEGLAVRNELEEACEKLYSVSRR